MDTEAQREGPLARHRRILAATEETDHVINRRRLRRLGVDRFQERRQVAAGRWAKVGRQTVSVRDAPLTDVAARLRAVWEVGESIAAIDGASALQAAGLKGWKDPVVHVSVNHRHEIRAVEGVRIHKVIRRVDGELAGAGVPRTRPEVAAIRAAHWATSDRQAATILAMTVQQRLATGEQLVAARRLVRGRTRRAFITQIINDVADGAQSLHELDFGEKCRDRGMPTPTRQVVRVLGDGRAYLDVYYEEQQLAIEIDGAGHLWGLSGVDDAFRANAVVIDGDRVLRINVIGWRLAEDDYLDQVQAALDSDWARANVAEYRHARGLTVAGRPAPPSARD